MELIFSTINLNVFFFFVLFFTIESRGFVKDFEVCFYRDSWKAEKMCIQHEICIQKFYKMKFLAEEFKSLLPLVGHQVRPDLALFCVHMWNTIYYITVYSKF